MAIHIVIGFDTAGSSSDFRPIYHGRDADAARAACEQWSGETTLWLRNPEGVRKTNPRLAAARDAEARAAELARQPKPRIEPLSPERLAAKVEQLERENARLRAAAGGDFSAPTAPPEVTAASTGAGEGNLSGEGGAGDLLSIASDDEVEQGGAAPGTLSPKGKAKGK